ncbi:hypothetical protein IWX90DRAFT_237711 [Phyllosticta citrichinensis]|uniref:Uncharacterized protein n=1 Tax=Phyllosticta citrichinensis TaxID=1130410 RepID=A0ABR1XQ13_9PEZI
MAQQPAIDGLLVTRCSRCPRDSPDIKSVIGLSSTILVCFFSFRISFIVFLSLVHLHALDGPSLRIPASDGFSSAARHSTVIPPREQYLPALFLIMSSQICVLRATTAPKSLSIPNMTAFHISPLGIMNGFCVSLFKSLPISMFLQGSLPQTNFLYSLDCMC